MEWYYAVENMGKRFIAVKYVTYLPFLMTSATWDNIMMFLAFGINFFVVLVPEYFWTILFLGLLQIYVTAHLLGIPKWNVT